MTNLLVFIIECLLIQEAQEFL
ncbi:hypothetical protein Godav_025127 [Gossypium davidsonii]|uniref:Uncharacterized protein n=2 Tax=Gossypium TaxID=3633 RepID=A0A7J8TFI6_GOSDV|nr:hypothetical protein [Gossypium davidsonii]MBA0637039.1 hypothetical protein [Gossypium davidsonii]MBA0739663.1 hypothetical protein [Gossypium gossypioides]